jgi:hypothetical protein
VQNEAVTAVSEFKSAEKANVFMTAQVRTLVGSCMWLPGVQGQHGADQRPDHLPCCSTNASAPATITLSESQSTSEHARASTATAQLRSCLRTATHGPDHACTA